MKQKLFIFLISCFLFHLSLVSFSQTKQEELKIEKIDGVKYYIHTVEKGHTLYAISKQYAIPIVAILDANPEAAKGLRIGQVLKIPVKKIDKKEAKKTPLKIEGEFLLHTIQQGETLFGLSKQYSVEQGEILKYNKNAIDGLKIGDTLKIPVQKIKNTEQVNILPAIVDTLINHTIKEGETLFSLAKQYNVNIDSIPIVNNMLPDGLKVGQSIRIPKLTPEVITLKKVKLRDKAFLWTDAIILKDTYNIALMLPFYLDMNDTLESRQDINDEPSIFERSKIALAFYEGALMAIDSLRKTGISVKLFVYDTDNDTSVVRKLLQKKEMALMHLIIGPLYKNNFKIVTAYARENGINIVCPISQNNKILLSNPHVSKVVPSTITQVEQMATYVANKYYNENILLVNSGNDRYQKLVNIFESKRIETLAQYQHLMQDTFKEISFKNKSMKAGLQQLEDNLSVTKTNIIVVPSYNQVFVSDLLTQLNPLTNDYNIIVFGMDKWKKFENIDIDYIHNLQLHIPLSSNINYDSEPTKAFIRLFREKYKTEPNKYGFLGFDVTYYYLSALKNFGITFTQNLPEMKYNALSISFDFLKTSIESGYENQYVYILKYEDFKLVKVN